MAVNRCMAYWIIVITAKCYEPAIKHNKTKSL